ncbi:MAG: hypothetical protein P8X43_08035 [Maritimibacter sp.]
MRFLGRTHRLAGLGEGVQQGPMLFAGVRNLIHGTIRGGFCICRSFARISHFAFISPNPQNQRFLSRLRRVNLSNQLRVHLLCRCLGFSAIGHSPFGPHDHSFGNIRGFAAIGFEVHDAFIHRRFQLSDPKLQRIRFMVLIRGRRVAARHLGSRFHILLCVLAHIRFRRRIITAHLGAQRDDIVIRFRRRFLIRLIDTKRRCQHQFCRQIHIRARLSIGVFQHRFPTPNA